MRKKATDTAWALKSSERISVARELTPNDFILRCPRTCELCSATAYTEAELEQHLSRAHSGWVDRLVMAMCTAEAS